jgi:hypothetical protein
MNGSATPCIGMAVITRTSTPDQLAIWPATGQ